MKATDALWSRLIKEIYPQCLLHGKDCGYFADRQNDEAHHIIKRRFKMTRWEWSNGCRLCPKHHDWAEANPEESDTLIRSKLPVVAMEKLDSIDHHKIRVMSPTLIREQAQLLRVLLCQVQTAAF